MEKNNNLQNTYYTFFKFTNQTLKNPKYGNKISKYINKHNK